MYKSKTTLVSKLQPKNVYTQKCITNGWTPLKNWVVWVDVSPFRKGGYSYFQLPAVSFRVCNLGVFSEKWVGFSNVQTCVYMCFFTYIKIYSQFSTGFHDEKRPKVQCSSKKLIDVRLFRPYLDLFNGLLTIVPYD